MMSFADSYPHRYYKDAHEWPAPLRRKWDRFKADLDAGKLLPGKRETLRRNAEIFDELRALGLYYINGGDAHQRAIYCSKLPAAERERRLEELDNWTDPDGSKRARAAAAGDRQRLELELRAKAPIQSKGRAVEDAAHLPLFVATNEPCLF